MWRRTYERHCAVLARALKATCSPNHFVGGWLPAQRPGTITIRRCTDGSGRPDGERR